MATFTYRVSTPDTAIPLGSSFISTLSMEHSGLISDVSLSLIGLTHEWSADLDVMLRYESGSEDRTLQVMSDVADGAAISNATLVFDDSASEVLAVDPLGPFVEIGIYRPFGTPGETLLFYSPLEPATPVGTATGDGTVSFASVFDGLSPDGFWSLYVTDDTSGLSGTLQGWSLSFQTGSTQGVIGPFSGTSPVLIAFAPGSGTSGSYLLPNGVEVSYSGVTEWSINTGDGNDVVIGPSVTTSLSGRDGNDYLQTGSGNDSLFGGTGRDTVHAGDGDDFVSIVNSISANHLEAGEIYNGGAGTDALVLFGQDTNPTFDLRTVTIVGFEELRIVNAGNSSQQRVILNDVQIGPGLSTNATINLITQPSQQIVTIYMGLQSSLNLSGMTILGPPFPLGTRFEIIGDSSNETLTGTSIDDSIEGNSGNDILSGGAGNDSLLGGSGNDILYGGSGADLINGGAGARDRVLYSDSTAGLRADLLSPATNTGIAAGDTYVGVEDLFGSNHTDTLLGDAIANILWGANGNDALYGRDGDDTLYGGSGNDLLYGGLGADLLDGGAGTRDRAMYSDSATGLRADLQVAATNTGIAAGDTYLGVEDLFGSSGADSLLGNTDGNAIWGANGDDALYGRDGDDTLYGGDGNDLLYGGVGADLIDGGTGTRDWVMYSDSATGLRADLQSAATNTGIAAGDTYVGVEDLYGSNQTDTLLGDTGANILWGANGNDALYGRDGADTLYGGEGNDLLYGGVGADLIDGGSGTRDRVIYSDSATGLRADLQSPGTNTGIAAGDTYLGVEDLFGSNAGDSLLGDTGANMIWGANGNDALFGRDGADTLYGGAGNDVLYGGLGADLMEGGSGADRFVFDSSLAGGVDVIDDFSVIDDTILLENAIFTALVATGPLAGTAFVAGASATTAAHRILYNSATGQLLYDADGNGAGAAVHFATLSTGLALTAADFLVI